MNCYLTIQTKKIGALILGLFVSFSVIASDSLRVSLEDVLNKALLHSKSIEQSDYNTDERNILYEQSKIDLLPKIALRGSVSYASNMPIYDKGIFNKPSQHDVIHYLYDTGADFYLNLYNGHRDLMNIKSKKLEAEMANIEGLSTKGKVKMKVCNLYLDLLLCYKNRALIEHNIEDQKEQLKEVQNLNKSGVVLHSDVLRIELELSKREMLLVKINHDIQSLNRQLQLITDIEEIIVPYYNLNEKVIVSYDKILEESKRSAFSLLKSEKEIQLKKLAIKQAESNYLPTIGLISSFTFANPQIFLYPYNDSWYSLNIVGLKASIPISTFYSNKNVVKASKLSFDRERIKHHDEEDQIEIQLLNAYLDYKLSLEQQTVCEKNISLAKENIRIIRNRYFQSVALVTDLLDADLQYLQTLFELESNTITIQKQYYFIEFIKGTI